MKKIDKVSVEFCCFLIAAILIAGYGLAMAGPFVASDPQQEATKFRLRLCGPDGSNCGAWVEGAPMNGGCWFDLASVARGTYKGEAQAYGPTATLTDLQTNQTSSVSDWSPSAFFDLTLTILSPPKMFVRVNP